MTELGLTSKMMDSPFVKGKSMKTYMVRWKHKIPFMMRAENIDNLRKNIAKKGYLDEAFPYSIQVFTGDRRTWIGTLSLGRHSLEEPLMVIWDYPDSARNGGLRVINPKTGRISGKYRG